MSFLMCTIKDRPGAKGPTCMWLMALVWREITEETPEPHDKEGVGSVGVVCICFCAFAAPVDCQRAETVRTKHHPSLLSSCPHLHHCLATLANCKATALVHCEMFGVHCQEV